MKFLGDVFLDKVYKVEIKLENFIFNLEYPFSTLGTPAENKINLGSDKPNILETFGKFPLAVNLANNHIMDYGEEAFEKTIKYLKQNKIEYFGAGTSNNNFNNPCILEENNKKIALFGYSCASTNAIFGNNTDNGSALLNEDKIIQDIMVFRNKCDLIIIQLHWGDEEIIYPKPNDVQKARKFIDSGADLIIGHHAHVIQSMEMYNDKYIFYGIGNFIFPDFNVPSYYNGERFLKSSNKVQKRRNKQSILVELDDNFKVSFKTTSFENGAIRSKNVKIPKWIPSTQEAYKRHKIIFNKKTMLMGFLKNPRIPNLNQFIYFLKN